MLKAATRSPWLRASQWASRRSYASFPESSTILVQHHPAPQSGSIRVLLLDRPEARNALSKQLIADLRRHVDEVQAKGATGGIRALIIASNSDKAFCAGADLRERRSMDQDDVRKFRTDMCDTFTALSQLPIPTISAISSLALGGGLEIALTTTMRVFSSNAVVGQPEVKLAIIPGAGGTFRLPALVGLNRARDMILTGRRITGPEAYFMGLCDRLIEVTAEEQSKAGVARAKVLDASIQLARDLSEGGPIALAQAMKAVNAWQQGQEAENEAYEVVLQTEDRIEALKAFADKRPPVFRGR